MQEKIDFVIMWVDGSDPKWLEEKNKYLDKKIDTSNAINRYRDMGVLKYWFRGVEKFAPWVNKIHFVTWGHVPSWLNTDNPKLNVVKHEDFISQKYLPVFNANAIEIHLHRIKDIADKFVFFNDDMFLLKPIDPSYYFKNGLPCDFWRDNIPYCDDKTDTLFEHILLNDKMLICRHFNKRKVIKQNFSKCFNLKYGKRNIRFLLLYKWPYMAGFDNFHMAAPFLKSTFEEVWKKEYDVLETTAYSKFRRMVDVNQYVFQLWQIYTGNFEPKSIKKIGKFFVLGNNNDDLFDCIDNQKAEEICINDSDLSIDYGKATKELAEHFEKILPDKSSFEK